MEIKLETLDKTHALGKFLGENLKEGMVLLLNGDLGAGKTTLTKSLAEGLGIKGPVTSPTFTIVNIYRGKINLYHIDTYRLEEGLDTMYLDFDEYFYGDGVTVVEWANKIANSLPEEYLEFNIKLEDGIRKIKISYAGEKYKVLGEKIYENFGSWHINKDNKFSPDRRWKCPWTFFINGVSLS